MKNFLFDNAPLFLLISIGITTLGLLIGEMVILSVLRSKKIVEIHSTPTIAPYIYRQMMEELLQNPEMLREFKEAERVYKLGSK